MAVHCNVEPGERQTRHPLVILQTFLPQLRKLPRSMFDCTQASRGDVVGKTALDLIE